MNYLIPVNRKLSNEELDYIKEDLENIMTQQIIISQLSNGITYTDTENMDSYERNFIFKKIMEMEKEKNDAKLKAIQDVKNKR